MNVGYAKGSEQAQDDRIQNETYFRALIENASDIITILEANGSIRYESPSIERILGYKPEELVGCNAFEFVHPDDVARIQSIFTAGLNQFGRAESGEFRFRHKDGSWRAFESTSTNLLDDPVVHGVIVNSRDVTERKRIEERVRLQSTALEAAANAIVITDHTGSILWTNPAFSRLTGYTSEEALGKNPKIFKSGTHDQQFYRDLWQTVSSGRVWHGDIVNRRKDGTLYNDEMTITPLRDNDGKVTHFIAIKQDVTGRIQAEKSLRESEAMFRSLGASSPFGILVTGLQGYCTYINPRCQEILGCSLIECRNDGWADFVHPEDRRVVLDRWHDYVKSGAGEYSLEYRIQRRDGAIRFVHMRSAPLRSDDGSPTGFVGSIEDITDRKRGESDLRESKQSLENAL